MLDGDWSSDVCSSDLDVFIDFILTADKMPKHDGKHHRHDFLQSVSPENRDNVFLIT
jgi:hypothetical protein